MLKRKCFLAITSAILSVSIQAAPIPQSGSGSEVSQPDTTKVDKAREAVTIPVPPVVKPGIKSVSDPSATTKAGKPHDQKASADLATLLQKINTLSAGFRQTSQGRRGRTKSESGEMQIKRPNQFRWEITAPYAQQIISRDNKVWMVDLDVLQVVIKKQDETMGPTPVQLLSGDARQFLEDYRVVRVIYKTEQTYTLRPQSGDDLFEQLDITFQKDQLESMTLKDSLGGIRKIDFSNVTINGNIADKQFTVDIPKDFDVIDETVHELPVRKPEQKPKV